MLVVFLQIDYLGFMGIYLVIKKNDSGLRLYANMLLLDPSAPSVGSLAKHSFFLFVTVLALRNVVRIYFLFEQSNCLLRA